MFSESSQCIGRRLVDRFKESVAYPGQVLEPTVKVITGILALKSLFTFVKSGPADNKTLYAVIRAICGGIAPFSGSSKSKLSPESINPNPVDEEPYNLMLQPGMDGCIIPVNRCAMVFLR